MATHLLPCLCWRNPERGIHLLPSQAGCNTLWSRSSLGRRELCVLLPPWTKSPLLSLYFTSCTPWLAQSSTAVGSERWDGGEASTQPHPENSYFQKIAFCLVLFMDSLTLSTQTPLCHHLKSPEVIHSERAAPLCLVCVWAQGSETIALLL